MSFSGAPRAIVVDASMAIDVLIDDPSAMTAWEGWVAAGDILFVPAHFGHEVANGLLRSVRLPAATVARAIERLVASGIEVVDRHLHGLVGAIQLAHQHGLTVYDAAYLDLALDIDADLATRDRKLRAAAEAEGIAVAT